MRFPPQLFRLFLFLLPVVAPAQVVISEIHYHPVENPHFDASGASTYSDTNLPADLSDDVHEFVEVQNAGATAVDVSGWKFSSGVKYTLPAGTNLPAGGFLVVAKNPARLATVYGLAPASVLGPFESGTKLSNTGDTVTLQDSSGNTIDSVTYSHAFPWAITADALGAVEDFTGLSSASYQYKGRSLQRVSPTASSSDPANWVAVRPALGATTFADLPTPGAANIVSRPVPKPVVTAISVGQSTDGAAILRANVPVKIVVTFSSLAISPTDSISAPEIQYFVDNVNTFESASSYLSVGLTSLGNNQFSAILPGKPDRSIVRYRVRANRGDGVEVVSPRPDDPAIVPVGLTAREPWQAYFVTPVRTSPRPIYDCFVSSNGAPIDDTSATNGGTSYYFNGVNSLQTAAYNAMGNLKRINSPNTVTAAYPREPGWPGIGATDRIWNGTLPAVFVENGHVRDIGFRFHGSRYNRHPDRKSYKVLFPDFEPYLNADSIFITDKGDSFQTSQGLYVAAQLPVSTVRYVDFYLNTDGLSTKLEQGEYNGDLLDNYAAKMHRLNPTVPTEETGEYYKSEGVIQGDGPSGGEGPWGTGNCLPLPATGGTPAWTELQRFDYTYGLQNHAWVGPRAMRDMVNSMWTARGDSYSNENPNLAATRAWVTANCDVDSELTSMSINNWMGPWDDTTQNHYFWHRIIGRDTSGAPLYRWVRIPWDFDGEFADNAGGTSGSIFVGEVGDPANNFRGPHYYKDSFIKAYRTEFKQRMWYLNNTLFDPENLNTLTFVNSGGGTTTFLSSIGTWANGRFTSVNSQTGLGQFDKPNRPTNTAPSSAAAVLPGASLTASAFVRSSAYTHAAPLASVAQASAKWEIRLASDTYDNPVYLTTSTTSLTTLPIPFSSLTFGQTYYWRVTYFDATGHPSITSAETSFSYGPTSTTAGSVSLNEILADNRHAVANGGTYPDYVELKNNTGAVFDLSGYALSDDDYNLNKYLFPGGTSIPANGYLLVWCDSDTSAPGLHSGFGIDKAGQRVLLTKSGAIQDVVTFGPQATDYALGRIPNGTGAWSLVTPSPNAVNTAVALGSVTGLKINEWMAAPSSGEDWFELYNSGTSPVAVAGLYWSNAPATPTNTKIPPLSYLGPKGYAKFTADGTTAGFSHVNFKLGSSGETLLLTNTNGTSALDTVTFAKQTTDVSQGRLPDGATSIVSFAGSASPAASNWAAAPVVINEVLPLAAAPLERAIELYNPTGTAVDLSNWWLSDDETAPKKYQLAAGSLISAGGYLVLYENQFGSAITLSGLGGEVVLSAVDGTGALTGTQARVNYDAVPANVSSGRVPTVGLPEFWPLRVSTFGQDAAGDVATFRTGSGAANAAPVTGPIIFNEVMYHPPDGSGGVDDVRDEFIELHNITTGNIDASGWRLRGDTSYLFPAGSVVLPGDYVLLVSFDPAADATSAAAFRSTYNLSSSVALFGPYSNKLANSTQSLELDRPGAAIGGAIPWQMVDRMVYADNTPWPKAADGNGSSLQRISRTAIGNDAANWSAAPPTAGVVNAGETPILDSDGDGIPDAWELAHNLDPHNAADALLDSDHDGQSNLAEYLAGTDPWNPADVLTAQVSAASANGVTIRFTARANRAYVIQYNNSLALNGWQPLGNGAVPAQSADHLAQVTDAAPGAQRFYRVVTTP